MRFWTFLAAAIIGVFGLACGSVTGVPIEMSKACDIANDGKYFQVSGVLAQRGSVFCSNTGGRMECGFDLLEAAGSANKLRVDIERKRASGLGVSVRDIGETVQTLLGSRVVTSTIVRYRIAMRSNAVRLAPNVTSSLAPPEM